MKLCAALIGVVALWLTGCTTPSLSSAEPEKIPAPASLPPHLILSLPEVRAINFLCLPNARVVHNTYSEVVNGVRVAARRDIACSSLDQTVTLILICAPQDGVCIAIRTNRPAGELYEAILDAASLTQ